MACGGCQNRRKALIKKIDIAIAEEEAAILNATELPKGTSLFLAKNHSAVLMRQRDKLASKKKEIITEGKKVPLSLDEKIQEQNKQINDHFSVNKSLRNITGQEEIIQKIKQSKSIADVIPNEFKKIVEPKVFEPFRNHPILTASITPRQKRSIMRNERTARRSLILAINLDKKEEIQELSKKYSDAIFDLFLLVKRTEK